MAEGFELSHIKTGASGVIPAPIETVWSLVRVFSSIGQWLTQEGFASLHSELMPGHLEGQIGSCRINTLDGQSFVEALEGLDDIKHKLRYKVVSHPNAVNPYPYAFLNFRSNFQLRKITLTDETFMEWEGTFDTELTGVTDMEHAIRSQFVGGIRGLQKIFVRPPSIGLAPPKRPSNKPMIGSTDTSARYRGQAPSQPQGQSESQGYPGFQPPQAFPSQHYQPQLQPSLGADMIVPRGQQPQQQQMQPQAQQFSQQQQQQQQMPSQAQQPSEGMSQRGSATSLQDLRQSAAASGGREQQQGHPNAKDSGGSSYSARSEAPSQPLSPQMAGQSLRVSGRPSRARRNSGYSSS